VNNSVAFDTMITLCHHLHHQTFQTPCPLSHCCLFLPPQNPWQPPICFLPLWIYLFWNFLMNRIIKYEIACVWLLSLSMFLEVHPSCSKYQYTIPFYGQITSHCICTTQFVLSSIDEHLSYFQLWAIVNGAAMNMHVQLLDWVPVFNSFGCIHRSRIARRLLWSQIPSISSNMTLNKLLNFSELQIPYLKIRYSNVPSTESGVYHMLSKCKLPSFLLPPISNSPIYLISN
jgi:hypothetical protein